MSYKELYPLTLPQKTFYYDYLLHQNNSKYTMGAPMVLNGDLDLDLLKKAYDYVIQKYDILRLRLIVKDGELYQKFLPEYKCNIEYRDFRNSESPFEDAMKFILKENAKPFPFENVNLFIEMVLQTGDKQFVWYTRLHHFANDAYGRSIVNQLISDTYNSLLYENKFPELKSYSYLDFLEDDIKYRESEGFKNSSEFWQNKLTPLAEALDFTTKKNSIKKLSLHTERVNFNLHRMCYASILKIADQAGVTPFQSLLGILYTTLNKLYNENDIVIGMPVLNRSNYKFRNTPGLFMNMMPLRLRLEPEWTFTDILNAIKTEVKECYRHQRLPLSETYKHFRNNPEFKNELFDVTIIYRKMDYSQKFGEARLHTVTLDTQLRNESLSLEIDEYDDTENVNLFFNYNPLVFSEQEIIQFVRCFEAVLFDLIYFPDKSISEVKFLSEFEQHKIIQTFNSNGEVKQTDKTIVAMFDDCVRKYSNNASVICNEESLAYHELSRRSNEIANYLLDNYNISRGDIICLSAERSIDVIAAMIGIMKSGAVCLPIDNQNPDERIKFILKNSRAKLLITNEPDRKDLTENVLLLNDIKNSSSENPLVEINSDDLAYIIYTSGSTGTPKGVLIEHGSFMNMFVNMIEKFGVTETDRVLQFASLGFDAAVFEIFQALLTGAALVIAGKEIIQNPISFIRYMNDKKVSVATIPPAYLSALDKPELPFLHTLITAGEQAITSDANHYNKFKKYINAYGPTETSVCASYFIAEKDKEYKDIVPIGKTVPGSSIYILNKNLEPLPIGFPGELCISGLNLARGYLNNKELTEQKFVPNPFTENLKMYRTGDKARLLPDGNIEFLGRIDEQVKIRGNRIELGEIENRLQNYPLIKEAVVLDIETNNNKDIAAFIISETEIDLTKLKKFLLEFLPEYMIPQHYIFIDKIPLTQNGKINKNELRNKVSSKSVKSTDNSSAPTEFEQKLITIFENVLDFSPIGVQDNFFALGGDSLKIARLITRIKKELQFEINFKTIFDSPTVRGVAAELEFSDTEIFDEIKPVPENEYYPLSHSQKRLWFLTQDEESAAAYNMPVPLLLEGNVITKELRNSINTIVDRHEALRTIFIDIDGTPYQKVLTNFDKIITEYDFSDEKNAAEKADAVINKEVMTPFDLSKEIPIRAHIVKIEKDKYVFLLMIHHIAGDGISIGIMMDEISKLYNSFVSGDKNFSLAPIKIQYKDYCVHEQNLLESEKYNKEKEFWLSNLRYPIPVLNLPADRMRPPVKTYTGKYVFSELSKTVSNDLRNFCKENNASPFMVILASIYVLLNKYTSQEDIIIGSPIAGRNHPELERQVGVYLNTIALRNNINSNKSFIDFLQNVKVKSSEAFSNSNYPFDRLIQDLNLERDTSRAPIFDLLVQYQNQDVTALRLNEIKSSFYMVDFTGNHFDLSFTFTEDNERIKFNIGYNTDLFDRDRIERAAGHINNILSGVLNNPSILIKDINLLDDIEKMNLLKMSTGENLKLDDKTVIDLFNEQVHKTPNNIALVFQDTELSYRELDERANAVANDILKNTPVAPDDIIAIMVPRSELMMTGVFGILKSGAAYLPISSDLPQERIRFMLEDSRAKLLLTESSLLKKTEEIVNLVNRGNEIKVKLLDIGSIKSPNKKAPAVKLAPSNLAYVIYTSGSTGNPKGVLIEHRSVHSLICSLTRNIYSKYNKPVNELLITSFMFDVSVKQIFAALCNGHTLHFLSEESKLAIDEIIEYSVSKKINMVNITPSLFSVMLEAGFGEMNKPDLKELYIGAEALPYKSVERFLESGNNDDINIYNFYGPTECCVESTMFRIIPEKQSGDDKKYGIVPIGKPIHNEQVYILDKDLNLCPMSIPGEIYIAGAGLARGYLNDEAKTNERFLEVPLLHGTRVYKTGDLGKIRSDGNIDFLGRIDDQVKVRGYRIELQEIEKRLREFEGISSCAVILFTNKDENEIAAYFTSDKKTDVAKIQSYLGLYLPAYMIPQYFVQIDSIPLSNSGKVNKKLLPDPLSSKATANRITEPSNLLEKTLVGIWKELLNIEEIGIFDDFFKVGGHSLIAMRLTLQIQKRLNIAVKVWEIFLHPTIASLAELLKDKKSSMINSIEKIEKSDYYPVSHSQRRLWILSKLEKHDSLYNIPAVLQLEGDLNPDALEKSFAALIQRHESFRTLFIEIDGQPYQKIEDKVNFKMEVIDYSDRQHDKNDIKQIINENSSSVFDLSTAPLLKVKLVKVSDRNYMLLICMHHIISDGWSFEVIFRELGIFYDSFTKGNKDSVQPLRIQYKDYAAWQNKILVENSLEEIKQYWHNKLTGPRPQTGFPNDFSRPEKYSNEGDLIIMPLKESLSKSLLNLSSNYKVSPFMTMLAAVNILLNKYTAEEDIIVGSPIAGRQHSDLENQIGFYVNTLALRNEVNPENTFLELLSKVKVTLSEAIDNQIYPFDKLVDELDVERKLNRNPFFDVMVVWMANNENSLQKNFSSIEVKSVDLNLNKSKFDLSLIFEENNSQIRFGIEYNTALFRKETIERISDNLITLLESIVFDPLQKITNLNIISPKEKQKLLYDFNDTKHELDYNNNVISMFEHQAIKCKNITALVYEETRLIYDELNRLTNRIANSIIKRFAPAKDEIIAVIIDDPIFSVASVYAIMKTGAAYVPVISDNPDERIRIMLKDSKCKIVLVDDNTLEKTRSVISGLETNDVINILNLKNIDSVDESNPCIKIPEDSLAYIIYTSGSTGVPKGVMIEHKSIYAYTYWLNKELYNGDGEQINELMISSFSFDASLIQIFGVLCSGNTLHLLSKEVRNNSLHIVNYIVDKKINMLELSPSLLSLLQEDGFNEADKPDFKYLYLAAEALPHKLIKDFLKFEKNKNVKIYNLYGPTECCVVSSYFKYDQTKENDFEILPIGKPIINDQIYVLDKNLNLSPIGATGEICIAGKGLARGYLGSPDLTKDKFVELPILKGERIYKTGDMGRILPDGTIEFLGRIDGQIKLYGYRIELKEIEERIRSYEGIKNVVVIHITKNGESYLAAYFNSHIKLSIPEIKNYLAQYLPKYMIPSYFIQLDKIPLSINGKVNRALLPLPEVIVEETVTLSNDPLENKICNIWKDLLNLESIGVKDNFFDIGGNSLTAIRFASRIHKEINIEINVSEIFQHPTIESLSLFIKSKNPVLFNPINKIEEMEYYPLSHSQHRLWFLSKLENQNTLYNLPAIIWFSGDLNISALEKSFNELIKRHESLRTFFVEIDDSPYQRISDKINFQINYSDYSDRPYNEDVFKQLSELNSSREFDLSVAPLFQSRLVKTAVNSYLLFINMHHIISDGWSLEIMLKELEILYDSYITGSNVALPPLRIQYKDYAAWQNRMLNEESLSEIKQYWLKKLSVPRQQLELPIDFKRPEKYTVEGDLVVYKIDNEIVTKLRNISSENNASLYMTLLACVNILLHKYTSLDDIILGTPVAGRQHSDLENQFGFFVNTVVLRNEVTPESKFLELLKNVKNTLSSALDNQIYPFDKLVEDLEVERIINRNPLFDVMVSWMINKNVSAKRSFSNLEMQGINSHVNKSMFDLSIIFEENNDEVGFALEYNTALFSRETIDRISEHFNELLKSILKNPAEKIRDLGLIPHNEKEKLLNEFNKTEQNLLSGRNVIDLFESQVNKCKDLTALTVDDRNITYEELNKLSNSLANYITGNISPVKDDIIAVIIDDPIWAVASLLAVMKTGTAYLPVMSDNPPDRINLILTNSKCKAVLTDKNPPELKNIHPPCPVIDVKQVENSNESNPHIKIDSDSVAYIIYTSGSTGTPKGVLIEHKSLYNLILSLNKNILSAYKEPLNELMITSFGFDVSVKQIFSTLCNGNCLHILSKDRRMDIQEIVEYITDKKINIADLTPSLFAAMLDFGFGESEKPELKELLLGSEALPYKYVKTFLSHENNKGINVYNFYGPTECCVESTYYKFDNTEKYNYDIAPIGKPIINEQIYILDKYLNLSPIGVPGEICIAGDGLAREYLNDPEKTKEKFVEFPLKGTKIYKTGDLGKMFPDGNIEFLGRIDEQVKVHGYRIELPEVEKHLLSYKDITSCVVTLHINQGTDELAAYFTSEKKVKISKLKNHLGQILPQYMIPTFFTQIENIPLLSNGKINKKLLPDPVQNILTGAEFENPTNVVETKLLECWQDVLGVENMSIHDNFFDLGGNSFLLVKLHKRISAKYPEIFKITDLFNNSKIIEQAEFIIRNTSGMSTTQKVSITDFENRSKYHDVAVVGIAAKIGDCNTANEFWQDLRLGVDFIGAIPEERIPDIKDWCEKNNMDTTSLKFREGCFLHDIDKFDYGFFKLSPGEASVIDPGQRLFMQTAYNALEDAGYAGNKLWGSRTGVFIGGGHTVAEYSKFTDTANIQDTNLLLSAQTPSILASRLSYILNLKGPAMLVDTACSSSLVAVHLACQSIRDGKIDSALVGGVNLNLLSVDTGTRTEIDSSDGRAHSFDDAASGTGGGEGVIAVMLKPLAKAIEDKDNIYAVVKGSYINQDGNSIGIAAPDADAQADVIVKAWLDAGVDPTTVNFIETHGTGTVLGDPIEIDGITKAYKKFTDKKHICAIGAVKANIGHLDSAAGLAGFLKAVLSLKHKELTPLTHFKNPNRNINFEESAAYVNNDLSDWNNNGHLLRCGVSSFGLSGTNCHVILEEAPRKEKSESNKEHKYLFTLSARNHDVLLEYIRIMKNHLYQCSDTSENEICYTLSSGRAHHSHRLAILFKTKNELISKLSEVYDNNLTSVKEKDIYASHFRITASNKTNLSDNEITENDIRKISDETNSILKSDSADSEKSMLAAKAYIKGADILWEEFYKNTTPQKVSLPGYPFEKHRCWVKIDNRNNSTDTAKDISNEKALTTYGRKYDNIFLGNCIIDTPVNSIYLTLFDENNWWLLREHKVMGFPALVGAAYLQIANEAGKNHFGSEDIFDGSNLFIDDFFMMQPITLYEESKLEVLTTINKNDDNSMRVEVHSKSGDNDWLTYSRLKISKGKQEESSQHLDIEEIKSRMTDSIEVDKMENASSDESFIKVSDKWNCLNKIYRNDNEYLGELSIPVNDQEMAGSYAFYPPLIDAAVSFGLNESGYLPYSYGNVELREPVSGSIYSYIKKKENGSKEISVFDITLTDTKGKILALFTDFMLKKVHLPKHNSFFHELIWKPWALKYLNKPDSKNTVMIYNSNDLSVSAEELKNITCVNLTDASDDDIFKSIFEKHNGHTPEKIIYMLPELFIDNLSDNASLELSLDKSLYQVFKFAKYLTANVSSKIDILFVGKNVCKVTGNETDLSSLNMAVSGLGQVLQMESTNINSRFLDIDQKTTFTEILNELDNGFNESFYYRALRNSKRFIREMSSVGLDKKQSTNISFKEEGVYIITGGTGGIGLELAGYIAKQSSVDDKSKVKLVLLNRSKFPSKSSWKRILKERTDEKLCRKIERLREIEKNSAGLYIISTDVTDYKKLEKVISKIKNDYGNIRGLIHCAGLPGDGFIYGKTFETFRDVISPKIQGTIYLSKLLEKEKLDFFIMASSLTGIMPAPGQSDYTAANIFLDAYASELNKKGLNAISIDFTAWKETGMAFDFNVVDDGVFKSVSTKDALSGFSEIIQHKISSVLFGETDLSLIDTDDLPFSIDKNLLVRRKTSKPAGQTVIENKSNIILKGRENEKYSDFEKRIAQIWANVLGYEEINIFDNYYDLGGDSIHAIKITSQMEKNLNIQLSIGDLFNHLTISELAEFLESKNELNIENSDSKVESSEIVPVEKRDYYPASSAQRRTYSLENNSGDKFINHIPEAWQIKGEIDLELFNNAFLKLIERQESLRTSFSLVENKLVQIVNDNIEFTVPVKEMTEDEARVYILNYVKPFDLGKAPLFRTEIIKLPDSHLVLFDGHHIIFDAFSMEILLTELFNYYKGIEPEPLKIQYKDYADQQNNYRKSDQAKLSRKYWLSQFEGEIVRLELPRRYTYDKNRSADCSIYSFSINRKLTSEVKKLSGMSGTSTFMILLTVAKILLGKLAGKNDVTIGVASMGRNKAELLGLIGMFINYLPVRTYRDENTTLAEFLKKVKNAAINAFANQDYPLDEVVEELKSRGSFINSDLFDVVFSYMNFEHTEIEKDDIGIENYNAQFSFSSEYDLMIYGMETKDTIEISFKYRKVIWQEKDIKKFSKQFISITKLLTDNTELMLNDFEMLFSGKKNENSLL